MTSNPSLPQPQPVVDPAKSPLSEEAKKEQTKAFNFLLAAPDATIRRVLTHDQGWIAQVVVNGNGLWVGALVILEDMIANGVVKPVEKHEHHFVIRTDADKVTIVPPDALVFNTSGEIVPVEKVPPTDYVPTESTPSPKMKFGKKDAGDGS